MSSDSLSSWLLPHRIPGLTLGLDMNMDMDTDVAPPPATAMGISAGHGAWSGHEFRGVVKNLSERPDSIYFRAPVKRNVPDYYTNIKKPMDLRTIQDKINNFE